MNIKEKIKVFISSKCGNEKYEYELIREALKRRLEDTGFVEVYVFESTSASSKSALDSYLNKLDDCDLVLFLIDNLDRVFPEGVMKEHVRSRELDKKSIYLFYNDHAYDETSIQKSLYGPNGCKFNIVRNTKEFIEEGYKSVIEDIFCVYKDYCRGRLHHSVGMNSESVSEEDIIVTDIKGYLAEKKVLHGLSNVIQFFKGINKYTSQNNNKEVSSLEEIFISFAKLLLCEKNYTQDDFDEMINAIVHMHDSIIQEVIELKLKAIKYCYCNNVIDAIRILKDAYELSINQQVPEWIVNDILIDLRNLEHFNNRDMNVIALSEAQEKLTSKEDILYYPVLDRLSNNIYNSIMNERNKKDRMTPHTSTLGTGIDNILEKIGEYFVWATYYGSYTHLKIVVRLLQDLFLNFYEIYSVDEWGYLALKYSLINSNKDNVNYICDRNCNLISSCSKEKIFEMYKMSNFLDTKRNKNIVQLRIFEALGYYFSNEDYCKIEKEFFYAINEWGYSEAPSVNLGLDIFNAIEKNIQRIDISKLLQFFNLILDKKYYRFYDDVFKIIPRLPILLESNDNQLQDIVNKIIEIIKDKQTRDNYNHLERCIVYLRICYDNFAKIIDNAIFMNWNSFWEIYSLEVDNSKNTAVASITRYIEEINERNKKTRNGVYVGYSYSPINEIKKILLYSGENILNLELISQITKICSDCLVEKGQSISEKIACLQLLMLIKKISNKQNINFNWDYYVSTLPEDKILLGYSDDLFEKDTILTLRINYLMFNFLNQDKDELELLTILSNYSDNKYENIKLIQCVQCYLDALCTNEQIDQKINFILLQSILRFINDSSYEIRYELANCLFMFIDKIENSLLCRYIDILSNDKDYRVKLIILRNIDSQSQDSSKQFKYIIEKYCVDNNYLVHKFANKIIQKVI